ncbi:MAG TPA: AbiEi antitoxin N-terminal domain-containing protein [Puia sp.]|nr:AbiEi antitoxin N-terminal domain-containing protein [Puia sp.]
MSTKNSEKLNQLFNLQKAGTVLQSSWLKQQGYNHDLQQRYKRSKWLLPIGSGAYIRAGDKPSFEGAIYALQQQSGLVSDSLFPVPRVQLWNAFTWRPITRTSWNVTN